MNTDLNTSRWLMAPAGIINFGNSCFLNSTLQALLSIESLHDVLSSWPLSNDHMSLTQSLLALNNKTDHENMSVRRLLHDLPVCMACTVGLVSSVMQKNA